MPVVIPNKLTQEDVQEFQTLYYKRYGVQLDDKQAYQCALQLIQLVYISLLKELK